MVRTAAPQPTNWTLDELHDVGVPDKNVVTDQIPSALVLPKPGVIEQVPLGAKRAGAAGATAAGQKHQEANP